MKKMGIKVVEVNRKIKDYHADATFAQEMMACIHKEGADAVFSYDYFPIISSVCEVVKVPYLSWIYDCPLYSLNSLTLKNKYNYIFCFDAAYTEKLKIRGAKNCYHLPLGVDVESFESALADRTEDDSRFVSEVSFVGSLYNDEKNRLRTVRLDRYTEGYIEGVIQAQRQIYGYNFVEELMKEKEVASKVSEACRLELGKMYQYRSEELAADAVNIEITARERETVLKAAAEVAFVDLYTGSEIPVELEQCNSLKCKGYADNRTEMPIIFNKSKINLNVTSRSIITGIPLRVLDILACGGFCLTNYQPEIEALLREGEEIVTYTDVTDLQDKIRYYLEHDKERRQIAENGKKAVSERFLLENKIIQMLECAGKLS